ncbi:MAG: hypothetical protein JSU59_00700 [Nitrospirota bacterium]|nr:MAG: hypothetical protein JSU59_00700 [Nitrospirota bacterium]
MPATPTTHWCAPNNPGLEALLSRLEYQSLQSDFRLQRELALSFVLEPYLDVQGAIPLSPLPEEVALAQLYLYADYLPNDGHPSLVEQVRDLVTEHVPEEERLWLDPFRHSYADLLTIAGLDSAKDGGSLHLRSLGNGAEFDVRTPAKPLALRTGQVLLTRLIRHADDVSLPGAAVVLSETIGQAVFKFTDDLRREIEVGSGEFALAEWPEFAKRYGYLMNWNLAKVRRGALAVADARVEYRNEGGQPFFYAIALYEHNEFTLLSEGMKQVKDCELQTAGNKEASSRSLTDGLTWMVTKPSQKISPTTPQGPVARLTLTGIQLMVEANSAEALDSLKHELASIFGFSLHFKGETLAPPVHLPPQVDLLSDTYGAPPVVVSKEEEQKLLAEYLESIYLDWAEKPSPFLNGETPRHYCGKTDDRTKVSSLIDQMEKNDLGLRRTGLRAYDYNVLRGHVGL